MRRKDRPPSAASGSEHPATSFAQESALLDTLLANAPVGVALLDTEFRYQMINEVLAESHGIAVAEHLGRTVAEVAPLLWTTVRPLLERVRDGATVINQEVTGDEVNPSRSRRHWLASYYPVRVGGMITGIGCIINEVTEAKEAERALRLRTNLYAMLSRTNRAVSRAADRQELFREVCEVAVHIGGFSFAWVGVPGESLVEMVACAGSGEDYLAGLEISLDPHDPRSSGPTAQAFLTGTYFVVNDLFATPSTEPWHTLAAHAGFASSAAFPIHEDGVVVASLSLYSTEVNYFSSEIVATLSEITPTLSFALDHFSEERRRREDEAQLRMHDRAINAISQGIVIADAADDNRVVYASPSFLRLTGYEHEDIIGHNCRVLQGPDTDPAAVAELRHAIANRENCSVEILNYRKDGEAFWNRVSISPVRDDAGVVTHFVGVQTDITARRELERQLSQSQKLEAIGTLAGGIAHDFNNMLLVIRGYSSLLAKRIDDAELQELARRIDVAVQRAADFTRRLLTFSHARVARPEPHDLNAILRETLTLLERIIGEDIELTTELAEHLPQIVVDRGQIEQALLNLVANARDAMPQGGHLDVRTSLVTLDEGSRAGTRPGPYVLIEVADTGVGMDEHTQEHVFEPFFTTKERGTGLGLSTIYGIVRQSGGHVTFSSDPGRGTSFQLYFPVSDAARVLAPRRDAVVASLEGHETILLVEDVDEARLLVARFLEGLGYTVLAATNGRTALAEVAEWRGPIDLLLTDIVMPQMNGRDLARQLLADRPELKVVFTSGFPSHDVTHEASFEGRSTFVEKPYLLDDVARAVRELLL